ncbi:MAG: HDIG domain-containing protein [Prevotella sp.]|nr:HDIG domain-containing protein [Prevotella sp.]
MKKYKIKTAKNKFWRNWLMKLLLVFVSVVIIVWFLPRTSGPQLSYDVGRPWTYGSLIANFDFPIYKTDQAISAEKDSITTKFEPYFNYDSEVEAALVGKFRKDFQEGIAGLSNDYIAIIAERLHVIYTQGILRTSDYQRVFPDTTRSIRVVDGKTASSAGPREVLSEISAYEMIFQDERLAQQRQLLQRCNLNEYIEPNLIYDKELSDTERNDLLSGIAIADGMVLSGQKIIDRGEIVDEKTYRVLSSFEREMTRRSADSSEVSSTIAGQVLFVGILILLFTMYLALFRKDYFDKPRSILMLYVMITLFPVLVSLMMEHNVLSVYIIPFAIAPIFIRVFMDSRTAFIAHVVMILICAAAVKYQYDFIILQLVAGLVAIYSLRELSQRAQLFRTALLVTLGTAAMYFALQLMQDNSITTMTAMDHDMYKHFVVNGVLLLFAYPLMLVVEKTFGFISNVTLIELSNTSKDLLRKLSEVAPGTFQHSIMVGNLAAAIANKIDADAQLVRTGALYHDIGKMQNPAFYTENQAGANPLEKMPRIEAAQIVISHVTEGLKLADKNNLPSIIRDFINTHHGLGKTKYFYISYKNEHPNEPVDDTLFSYPGPNPFTREQAILMMADTAEAASRSLKEYTEESISTLINKLIDQQIADGYFQDCPITFHDINVAKKVLTERLKNVYHTRIAYPEQNKKKN